MNKNLTDITFLLDRSGSMAMIQDDVVGGIDAFIQEQKKVDGKANFTLIQFDSSNPQEVVLESKDIKLVEGFTSEQFTPRGGTPLLDALGMCIENAGKRLAAMREEDRPGTVQMVVFTDGEENSSSQFSFERIKAMVTEQTDKYSWHFLFLGASIDAFAEGATYGFSAAATSNIGTGRVRDALLNYSTKTSNYRSMAAAGQAVSLDQLNFTKLEQDEFEKDAS